MDIVWPVTGLYFPLIGLWSYHWKQIFLSATHCGSGCVIGDVLGPPIVFGFGLMLLGSVHLAKYATEFVLAYAFGVAFQYFPIRSMRDIPPHEAILDAVKADTLALVAFEVGMFSWMAIAQ